MRGAFKKAPLIILLRVRIYFVRTVVLVQPVVVFFDEEIDKIFPDKTNVSVWAVPPAGVAVILLPLIE
jgi:hypothetical protein